MGALTDDDLLADAIGYVALSVLGWLAGDAEARRALLDGFLRLAGTHGPAADWPPLPREARSALT